MKKQDEEPNPFDAFDIALEPSEPAPSPIKGKVGNYEVFRMYDEDGDLLYISRSAQLHKLKDRDFWRKVVRIEVSRWQTPGQAEDDKLLGIEHEKPKWNVMNAGI